MELTLILTKKGKKKEHVCSISRLCPLSMVLFLNRPKTVLTTRYILKLCGQNTTKNKHDGKEISKYQQLWSTDFSFQLNHMLKHG